VAAAPCPSPGGPGYSPLPMSASAKDVADFIQAQLPGQRRFFGAEVMDQVLAHVASTSIAGSLEEVLGSMGGARVALVGVGAQVNLSPRFNWHTEIRDGRLTLFHGDGLPLKTYLNLKTNPLVVRVLLDPETFGGWLLTGRVEEFQPEAEPAAYQAIVAGFQAGGWGRPARTFRFTAETIAPLAPAG